MLSPGQHYRLVPRDLKQNLLFRQKIHAEAARSRDFRAGLLEMCRQDILFWINVFAFQVNPLKKGEDRVGPFITWDFQDAALLARPEAPVTLNVLGEKVVISKGLLWAYENNQTVVIEKSREMGGTWLVLLLEDWTCLFHRYMQWLNISRNEKAVTKKTIDALLSKIKFVHAHLPDWMLGADHIDEQKTLIEFGRTNAAIVGESSTADAGVSGRFSGILVDEVTKIADATELRQRTASTADFRIFVSTHAGENTEFYKLTQTPEMVQIQMHWSQHPQKRQGAYRFNPDMPHRPLLLDPTYGYHPDYRFILDGTPLGGPYPGLRSPWYDQKCRDIGNERGVSVELDINPAGSVSQFFNMLTIGGLITELACDPWWEGELEFDDVTGTPIKLREQAGGLLRLWVQFMPDGSIPAGHYAVGADISTGEGATPSCLSIMNAVTGEKVGEYVTANLRPHKFAPLCVAICRLFVDPEGYGAILNWERAGPGKTFGVVVGEMGYRRLYYPPPDNDDPSRATDQTDIPGWYPTKKGKPHWLQVYRDALEGGLITNRSRESLRETARFMYLPDGTVIHTAEKMTNDPTGASLNHGDRTTSDMVCWMACRTRFKKPLERQRPEEAPVGSLAWRREMRQNQERQLDPWM